MSEPRRPYIITNEGDMLWRKDPSHRIAIVTWPIELNSYMFQCVHCPEGNTCIGDIRREAADLAYQHFIAKHTTLTDEGLSA